MMCSPVVVPTKPDGVVLTEHAHNILTIAKDSTHPYEVCVLCALTWLNSDAQL